MPNIENSRSAKLDAIFGTPLFAVLLAIGCNVLWGSAFPFIKMGYRLFSIDSGNTASIFCFAGVRFMLGSVLVLLGSILLQGKAPRLPRGRVAAECCALGLWQTTAQALRRRICVRFSIVFIVRINPEIRRFPVRA